MKVFDEKRKKEMRKTAGALLLCNGISPSCDGYHYILDAVDKWHEFYGDLPPLLTKEVYPAIGKKYNRSWSAVERAMRVQIIRATATEERMKRCISAFGCAPPNGEYYCIGDFVALLALYAEAETETA